MTATTMRTTVKKIIAPGKGILAADESSGTIKKRFDSINLESTETTRRDYRELLFTAPGFADHISGVILFDETIRQNAASGTPLVKIIADAGVVPGIKVDKGLIPIAGRDSEKTTQGLDGLGERMDEYRSLGAGFAKWRAVYDITDRLPSRRAIELNAEGLARYAAICQAHDVVPIVEPEVLMDGDHTIERCAEVTEAVLHEVFHALYRHGVVLEEMILKPNMVLPGKSCARQVGPDEVAEATIQVFQRTVPAAVPGICFLSGGQTDEDATANLNAMNAQPQPWVLSFSYGRALQAAALKSWAGKAANHDQAQQAFVKRARLNGLAALGRYEAAMEKAA